MKTIPIFALILTLDISLCSALNYADKKRYWRDIATPNIGRPSKVIIDEIITRSVSFPAKSKYNLNDDNFSFENLQKKDYPTSEYSSEDYPSTDLSPKKYPVADFMLTNRRRDDITDNVRDKETNYALEEEDGGGVVYEAGEELAPIEEKSSIEMIPENPTAEILRETTSSGPGGIHIHVEQTALQTLFDKIPWEDLVDSLNNKLTHKQEIRQVREHVFTDANQDSGYDHSRWGQQAEIRQQQAQQQQLKLRQQQLLQKQKQQQLQQQEIEDYQIRQGLKEGVYYPEANRGYSYNENYTPRSRLGYQFQYANGDRRSGGGSADWPQKPVRLSEKPVYCVKSYQYQTSGYPRDNYNLRQLGPC